LKNNPAKCRPDYIWNDGTSSDSASPQEEEEEEKEEEEEENNNNNNNNNKMSSDMVSFQIQKFTKSYVKSTQIYGIIIYKPGSSDEK